MPCLTLKYGGGGQQMLKTKHFVPEFVYAMQMEKQQFILENRQDQHMNEVWSILRLIGGRKKHLICGSMFTRTWGGQNCKIRIFGHKAFPECNDKADFGSCQDQKIKGGRKHTEQLGALFLQRMFTPKASCDNE